MRIKVEFQHTSFILVPNLEDDKTRQCELEKRGRMIELSPVRNDTAL